MALIEWNNTFSVGISQLDSEHQRLVEMINTLYDAMKQGKGKDAITTLLNELSAYVVTHFSHEEKWMQEHSYPQFTEHKKIHDDFVRKVGEYKTMHQKGLLSANQLLTTLRDWLVSHICHTDSKYGMLQKTS